jgi:hypothetical protein
MENLRTDTVKCPYCFGESGFTKYNHGTVDVFEETGPSDEKVVISEI